MATMRGVRFVCEREGGGGGNGRMKTRLGGLGGWVRRGESTENVENLG
ncbi:MAG: hypothetical protein BJ554DRAFT_8014 [Olpidium bornovanus]|uniref:Uncharacterized protein n=1 Tax=Olpidium bornovanus TaxID=278681 RepID=A0A8H7ZVE4_9FUNG|nr:MAG: hypothetical protein BJ554DRAFT_8014 [Olpidium bornovanus]